MRTTSGRRPPEQISSDSSDSETEEESLFGPQCLEKNPKNKQQSQRLTADPWVYSNRADGSLIRCGSDRELQAFINMRDQADKATEVMDFMWYTLAQHIHIYIKEKEKKAEMKLVDVRMQRI